MLTLALYIDRYSPLSRSSRVTSARLALLEELFGALGLGDLPSTRVDWDLEGLLVLLPKTTWRGCKEERQ